jgi:hypothetical protein
MSAFPRMMSALPPKADMCGALAHVRFVPKADIKTIHVCFRPLWGLRAASKNALWSACPFEHSENCSA